MRACQQPVDLVLHDDGTLTADDRERLRAVLPGVSFVEAKEADVVMEEKLKNYPWSAAFRTRNVLARKLLDVSLMSELPFCFSDSDICYIRPFSGFPETAALVFTYSNLEAYSIRPWHVGRSVAMPSRVNTGMMYVREFDLDFIEWFLSRRELQSVLRRMPFWAEQTAWAALGAHLGCELIVPEQIAVWTPTLKLTGDLVGIHFTTAVRDKVSLYQWMGVSPVTTLRTFVPSPLSPWSLAVLQLQRSAGRVWRSYVPRK